MAAATRQREIPAREGTKNLRKADSRAWTSLRIMSLRSLLSRLSGASGFGAAMRHCSIFSSIFISFLLLRRESFVLILTRSLQHIISSEGFLRLREACILQCWMQYPGL